MPLSRVRRIKRINFYFIAQRKSFCLVRKKIIREKSQKGKIEKSSKCFKEISSEVYLAITKPY